MSTDTKIVRLVVTFMGGLALMLAGGLIFLVDKIIGQGAGANMVDPAAATAVGLVSGAFGMATGSLGTLLVSTRSVDTSGVAKEEGRKEALKDVKTLENVATTS